jgi:uncharacterized protein (DUF1778 family)
MTNFFNFADINLAIIPFLLIDLLLAVAFLGAMRFTSGIWSKVNTTEELSRRDNFAFGISIAGSVTALGIVLSGAVSGGVADTITNEVIGMSLYGLIGLLLINVGRVLHDKLSLNLINKAALIQQQNSSVALVDAAALIATAIIIRAVLIWAEGMDLMTLVAILSGFFVSQIILLAVTRLRERQYSKVNQGEPLQKALANGQLAIAVRHMGYLIGTALAVSTASQLLIYDPNSMLVNLSGWLAIAIVLTLLLHLTSLIAKKIILAGINLTQEVDHQENIGVASIEMMVTIVIALIINNLLA